MSEHWASSTDLKKKPLQSRVTRGARASQKPASLLGEIGQDGARLEDGDLLPDRAVVVYDSWDFVVRANAQEPWLELVARTEIDHRNCVREAELFKRNRDLEAVRCGRSVEIDHLRLR